MVGTRQHLMRSMIKFHLKGSNRVKYDANKFNIDEALLAVQGDLHVTLLDTNDDRLRHNRHRTVIRKIFDYRRSAHKTEDHLDTNPRGFMPIEAKEEFERVLIQRIPRSRLKENLVKQCLTRHILQPATVPMTTAIGPKNRSVEAN